MFIFRDRLEGRSGRRRVPFSGPSGREREVAGSIYATVWKVGAGGREFNFRGRVESRSEGREINCRYLERGGAGSRAQFPGPSRREEQEVAGLVSGTEWERGAEACRFDSRHQTNTQRLENTKGEETYFALLTARPSLVQAKTHKYSQVPEAG